MSSETELLPPRSRGKTPHTTAKKKRPFLKAIIFIALFSILGGLGYVYVQYERMLDNMAADHGGTENVPNEQLAKSKPLTVLLLGLDSRAQTGTMNTDVMMVVSLNPERKTAAVVSLPRDAYVDVTGYKARKANAYYSVVNRLERERANSDDKLVATDEIKSIFSEFFEIPIDYVAVVNFNGFEQIIDQLGGIDVDVDADMRYVDPTDGTNIDLKKGYQKLDGKNALDFVRYRLSNNSGTASSSDMQRNERQQKVVAAMIDKIGFQTILKLDGIFESIGSNVTTDMPKAQLKSFISTYITISNENIVYQPIEGKWKSPFVQLDSASFTHAKESLQAQLD